MAKQKKPNIEKGSGKTPRPINLHLLNTAGALTAAAFPWVSNPQHREAALKVVTKMTQQMMAGLGAYQLTEKNTYKPAYKSIWQGGGAKLLQTGKGKGEPVLVVPSLINKHDILDLDAQHSFVQYLNAQGFDAYILAWGAPTTAEQNFRVDDYITQYLLPALASLHKSCGPVHIIGYCMGGTMAAGAVATLDNAQKYISSLTLLATPWDFEAGDKTLAIRMQAYSNAAAPVMAAMGTLPVDWIQALFASIDPLFAFNKFRAFAEMDKNSPEAQRFVIVEDWLNDGIDLVAPAAKQVLQDWYTDNQPINGVWTIGKNIVDAANIKVPTFVIAAANDKLVPAPAALAIAPLVQGCKTLAPDIGHIGMMASPRAVKAVWEPVVDWLKKYRTAT